MTYTFPLYIFFRERDAMASGVIPHQEFAGENSLSAYHSSSNGKLNVFFFMFDRLANGSRVVATAGRLAAPVNDQSRWKVNQIWFVFIQIICQSISIDFNYI